MAKHGRLDSLCCIAANKGSRSPAAPPPPPLPGPLRPAELPLLLLLALALLLRLWAPGPQVPALPQRGVPRRAEASFAFAFSSSVRISWERNTAFSFRSCGVVALGPEADGAPGAGRRLLLEDLRLPHLELLGVELQLLAPPPRGVPGVLAPTRRGAAREKEKAPPRACVGVREPGGVAGVGDLRGVQAPWDVAGVCEPRGVGVRDPRDVLQPKGPAGPRRGGPRSSS